MRHVRPIVATLLALGLAVSAAGGAVAKSEAATLTLDNPLPVDALPGSEVEIAWTLGVIDPNGATQPFSAEGIFIRLAPASGTPVEVAARQDRPGHYIGVGHGPAWRPRSRGDRPAGHVLPRERRVLPRGRDLHDRKSRFARWRASDRPGRRASDSRPAGAPTGCGGAGPDGVGRTGSRRPRPRAAGRPIRPGRRRHPPKERDRDRLIAPMRPTASLEVSRAGLPRRPRGRGR